METIQNFRPVIERLLRQERYIDAIYLYKGKTAVGLGEAKRAVDVLIQDLQAEEMVDLSLKAHIEELINEHRSGEAIRLYSEQMNTSAYFARGVIVAMRKELRSTQQGG